MRPASSQADSGQRLIPRKSVLANLVGPGDDWLLAEFRLILQMARFPLAEMTDPAIEQTEACRVLERIRREQQGFGHWLQGPGKEVAEPSGGVVKAVADDVAQALCRRFHYIGTPRDGVSLGLYLASAAAEEPPSTLLVFSPFDLKRHCGALPKGCSPDQIVVLSRVYSFRWAPHNSFSYCFKRALRALEKAFPSLAMVLSYVNPNLGFTASSYLAANWLFFREERDTRYDYLDGEYITQREIERRFGRAAHEGPQPLLEERLTHSRISLAPLQLWAYPLRRSIREQLLARRRLEAGR
jgi:hypothetical protein